MNKRVNNSGHQDNRETETTLKPDWPVTDTCKLASTLHTVRTGEWREEGKEAERPIRGKVVRLANERSIRVS